MTYDTSGIYIDTLQSIAGCDSILTLDLTINESYDDVVDTMYRCVGDSALLAGSYQTVSGVYVDTLQSSAGCDSVVSTTLIVDTVVYSTTDLELCYGDSALFGGVMYDTSGVYVDTLQAIAGCDSIAILNLTIRPLNYTIADTMQRCVGDSALLAGSYQTVSGVYVDTLQSITGCDSIIEVYLNFNPIYTTQNYLSICNSDSALLEGNYQTSSGFYYDTLSNSLGCDSIIITELVVDTIVYVQLQQTICQNDSLEFGGQFVNTEGIYYDTLIHQFGCDTLNILNLIVDTIFNTILIDTICDVYVTQTGDSLTTSGIYYDTLTSTNGCDSLIEYNITINNSISIFVVDTACGSYTSPIGNIYTSTGTYVDTLQTLSGCDSLIIIDLTIYCDDIDGDGIPDVDDDDNDNDGISDDDEGTGDTDGDGIPDYLDIDSDNDGIYDVVESGNGSQDTNNDGVIDINDTGFADNDSNGMADGSENTNPLDSDGDGIPNFLDLDSDNDGIYDVIESGNGIQDTNNDGVVDINDNNFTDNDGDGMADGTEPNLPTDSDNDGILDYVDLDSDNDGIYDVVESGNDSLDSNNDGFIDTNDVGYSDNDNDGMSDNSEGSIPQDTDNDGNADYIDLDSDGDGCDDVTEAGFTDGDGDGYLGNLPILSDSLGLVVSGVDGYVMPSDNDFTGLFDFQEPGSEAIFDIEQPSILEIFSDGGSVELIGEASSLSIIFYQWEMSGDDGFTWETLINDSTFNGVQTTTLSMANISKFYDNYLFRLKASTPGFACGDDIYSQESRIQLEQLFIPEGFSPDGNGVNDTWHISGIERYPNNRVEIYNRWEVKVFEINSYGDDNEWDGRPNVLNNIIIGDGQVPEGTYYYVIDLGENNSFGNNFIKGYVYIRRN